METSSDEFEEKGKKKKKYERRGWIEEPGANLPSLSDVDSDSPKPLGMPIGMAEMQTEDDEIRAARIRKDSACESTDSSEEATSSDESTSSEESTQAEEKKKAEEEKKERKKKVVRILFVL